MTDQVKTALDKAREVRNKIAGEVKEKKIDNMSNNEVVVKTGEKEMNSAIQIISKNNELMKMYKDNAKVGSDNLGGSSPLLKVHTAGKSSNNELADGSEPNNGWFFYKPTREQFENITCHILTISKGFRTKGFEENKDDVFNQIVSGVITNNNSTKPFILYLTGLKLAKMWDFGKEASAYTNMRPVPVPMFALTVKLSTVKEKTKYGNVWLIDFEIVKDESGMPKVLTDEGEFVYYRDMVSTAEDMVSSLTNARSTEEMVEEKLTDSAGNEITDIKLEDSDYPF